MDNTPGVTGIDAKASVNKATAVELEPIAEGLTSPVGLIPAPDDSGRLFIIDQAGQIRIVDAEEGLLEEPFLDVSASMVPLNPGYDERGLLGFAFHPEYQSNGRFFVYYTAPPNAGGPEEGATWDNISRIAEFRVSSPDANTTNPGSETIILEIDQPQRNHEGGTIAFGPDGYLYISIGDGGGADDTGPGHVEDWYETNEGGNSQNIEANLLGKILRINVDAGSPYGIPADNPFVGETGRDEIYAYGLRNPFRFSFDTKGSQQLFAGDAGQKLWEEINIIEKGGNYGWNVKEATHCFDASDNMNVLPDCPDIDGYGNPLLDPVIEMKNHDNPEGGLSAVIIGGYVYRGNDLPGFQGKYIFGSYSQGHDEGPSGEIYISNPAGPGLWSFQEIEVGGADTIGYYLKGFGQDLEGEVYVAGSLLQGPTGDTGTVFKLVRGEKTK